MIDTFTFISNYNNDLTWVPETFSDYVIYDQSDTSSLPNTVKRPHGGSDIYDKFSWIIENYDYLPDTIIMIKGNLFKYITREEFDILKNRKSFTPLLTQTHKTYLPICFYSDGLYNEINNYWYLNAHSVKGISEFETLKDLLEMRNREYNTFAPGSNYILTRENILKHSKIFYQKLRSFLEWSIYPGEAQMIERNLYHLWQK